MQCVVYGSRFPCFHSQTIQNNLERSEFETKARLGGKIESLEREMAVYKQRLIAEEERRSKMVDAYETQVIDTMHVTLWLPTCTVPACMSGWDSLLCLVIYP